MIDGPLAFTPAQRKKAGIADFKAKEWRLDCRVFAHDVLGLTGDKWQELFWAALSGPHLDPKALRMLALKACKGPGKTFALAVGGWWWLFTRWHANGVAMSITGDNLRDNLWAEMARVQQRSQLLTHFFAHRGERIEAKEHPKDWWLSARSFPQNADKAQQANTLAGTHGRHPFLLGDEVGDWPDGVLVAAEAMLSSLVDGKPPDGRIMIAGNPTSTEGPLYRVTTRDRGRWWVYEISSDPADPNRTPRVDPVWAQEQLDTWGRESDFCKVNILGQFPSQQANKLIGPDAIREACNRSLDALSFNEQPLIFGLDVARYGDNASVLFQRQGNMSWFPKIWRETSTMQLADYVAQEWHTKMPDAVFVDQTGVGGPVVDRLRDLGVPTFGIDFGGSALDTRFADRRSEMYWKMAEWIKKGGTIPGGKGDAQDKAIQLHQELMAPNFAYKAVGKTTKFKLESKDEMKKRGVASPDQADALALTFAAPVVTGNRRSFTNTLEGAMAYRSTQMHQGKFIGGTEADWDPFAGEA